MNTMTQSNLQEERVYCNFSFIAIMFIVIMILPWKKPEEKLERETEAEAIKNTLYNLLSRA